MFKKVQAPRGLKGINYNLYKHSSYKGYFLLDEIKDGKIPVLFYDGKWREDEVDTNLFEGEL